MKFIEKFIEESLEKPYADKKYRSNGNLEKMKSLLQKKGEKISNEPESKK